jgi:uncharacterized membrane protein (DUF4010 family)
VLACVSFIGYVAVKYLGASRGVLVAAALGGLVSSTAVTIANARHAAAGEGASRLLAAGVAVATAISFLRVFAIAAVMQPRLLLTIGPTLAGGASLAIGFALFSVFWNQQGTARQPGVEFRNPFGFWTVVGFALLLGAVIMLGRAVGEGFGDAGVIAGATFVGLADVDAVTVSMARLTPSPLGFEHAGCAILGAVASNTVSKIAIGAFIGRGWFAAEIAAMALFLIVGGGIILSLTLSLS